MECGGRIRESCFALVGLSRRFLLHVYSMWFWAKKRRLELRRLGRGSVDRAAAVQRGSRCSYRRRLWAYGVRWPDS